MIYQLLTGPTKKTNISEGWSFNSHWSRFRFFFFNKIGHSHLCGGETNSTNTRNHPQVELEFLIDVIVQQEPWPGEEQQMDKQIWMEMMKIWYWLIEIDDLLERFHKDVSPNPFILPLLSWSKFMNCTGKCFQQKDFTLDETTDLWLSLQSFTQLVMVRVLSSGKIHG